MWHFQGVKTYSDPSYIFSGGHDPLTPRIYAPGRTLEALGPINESAVQFSNDLGHRITSVSTDDKEAQFLFQRLTIASAEI